MTRAKKRPMRPMPKKPKIEPWATIGRRVLEDDEPQKTREPSPRLFFVDIVYENMQGERVYCTTSPLTEKESESLLHFIEGATSASASQRYCDMDSTVRKARHVVFPSQQPEQVTFQTGEFND